MHAAYNTIVAAGLAVAGALLSIVHSLTGSVGVALMVAGVTALICGLAVAQPTILGEMGLALAVVAAFTSGLAWAGVVLLTYGTVVQTVASPTPRLAAGT